MEMRLYSLAHPSPKWYTELGLFLRTVRRVATVGSIRWMCLAPLLFSAPAAKDLALWGFPRPLSLLFFLNWVSQIFASEIRPIRLASLQQTAVWLLFIFRPISSLPLPSRQDSGALRVPSGSLINHRRRESRQRETRRRVVRQKARLAAARRINPRHCGKVFSGFPGSFPNLFI